MCVPQLLVVGGWKQTAQESCCYKAAGGKPQTATAHCQHCMYACGCGYMRRCGCWLPTAACSSTDILLVVASRKQLASGNTTTCVGLSLCCPETTTPGSPTQHMHPTHHLAGNMHAPSQPSCTWLAGWLAVWLTANMYTGAVGEGGQAMQSRQQHQQ